MIANEIPSFEADDFRRLIATEPDVLERHPCVIRGYTQSWPAKRKWMSFDYLREVFGHMSVTAGAPQFVTHKQARMVQVATDFGSYLDYVENPNRAYQLFEGKWIKGNHATWQASGLPLYCGNLHLVRHAREPILADITPIAPGEIDYINDEIPYYYQSGNHVWLYISPAGALTPLHQDNNAVISYLAQLKGEKRAILFAPSDKAAFFVPEYGYIDPLNPQLDQFPRWLEARAWTAALRTGETLIWGSNWAHHVETLEDSITVSVDLITTANLDAYTSSIDWRDHLGHFAQRNARLVRDRVDDLRVHAGLDGDDRTALGRDLMIAVLRTVLNGPTADRSRAVKARMLALLEQEAG